MKDRPDMPGPRRLSMTDIASRLSAVLVPDLCDEEDFASQALAAARATTALPE